MKLIENETSTPRLDTYQLDTMPGQNIERHLIVQSPIQYNDMQTRDLDIKPKNK